MATMEIWDELNKSRERWQNSVPKIYNIYRRKDKKLMLL